MKNPEINFDAETAVDRLMADISNIRDPRKDGILAFHQTIRPAHLVDPSFDKDVFLYEILPSRWNVRFTPDEINALTYIQWGRRRA